MRTLSGQYRAWAICPLLALWPSTPGSWTPWTLDPAPPPQLTINGMRPQVIELRVYMDAESSLYLKGMTIDYQGGLKGKGFIFENPNARKTCSCGESFGV